MGDAHSAVEHISAVIYAKRNIDVRCLKEGFKFIVFGIVVRPKMRGYVALRLIHNLDVVLHTGAQKPLVDFRFLEHQRLALLVMGNGIVIVFKTDSQNNRYNKNIAISMLSRKVSGGVSPLGHGERDGARRRQVPA